MTKPQQKPTLQYPPGSYVEVYRIGRGTEQHLLARCTLLADGTVQCKGEERFVRELNVGVTLVSPLVRSYGPADGIAFLQAVRGAYNGSYIVVSTIHAPQKTDSEPS